VNAVDRPVMSCHRWWIYQPCMNVPFISCADMLILAETMEQNLFRDKHRALIIFKEFKMQGKTAHIPVQKRCHLIPPLSWFVCRYWASRCIDAENGIVCDISPGHSGHLYPIYGCSESGAGEMHGGTLETSAHIMVRIYCSLLLD
jgi:hypothetical protein